MKNNVQKFKKKKNNILFKIIIFLFIVSVGYISLNIFNQAFKIDKIIFIGNEYYTGEELAEKIGVNKYHNSLIYYLAKKRSPVKNIPFIDAVEIKLDSPNILRIEVYEKTIIGCVEYMGMFLYFDKDGIVVDISENRINNIPVVLGLKYNNIVLHNRIPVDNDNVFTIILDVIQLLKKHEIKIDKIGFDTNGEIILYINKVRILLGQPTMLNEKVTQLKEILPNVIDKKGELNMKRYDYGIYFKNDI